MFVTMPQFEEPGMSKLAGSGQKYWRAITASFPGQPWYQFVYEAQVLDARVNLTMLVAWEETLVDIINLVPSPDHRAAYRVESSTSGGLEFRSVRAIWRPTEAERAQGMGAVLQLEGDDHLVDANMHPVASDGARRVVFRAPPAA